jgi:PAS domain-containing protein
VKHFLDKIGHDILAFTSMYDFIKDLIFLVEVCDDSFRYTYVNQSALKVLNIKGDILGKRLEDVVPQRQVRLLIQKYRQVLSTQQPVEFIEELLTENGVFIGELLLNPILTNDGECKYILAIVRKEN